MSSSYSLTFTNNSDRAGTVCLFQKDHGYEGPNAMSLAWMARAAHPGMSASFSWSIDYSFFWAETGVLRPGVQVNPGQTIPADPRDSNSIVLSAYAPHDFRFSNQQRGQQAGSFYINCDATNPNNMASVGVSMSGAGTFAVPAMPNYMNVFTPRPSYWLTFGNYRQGQVLDVDDITDAVQIDFPGNVYDMKVTLKDNGQFTVEQGR
jgi:hypothetical protein